MKTKNFYMLLVAFFLTSFNLYAHTSLPPTTTAGIYLYIPGITTGKGSVANNHPDEVEVLAFSYGFSKGEQVPNLQDYSLTKYNDGITNVLQSLLVSGTLTDGVELRIYKTMAKGDVQNVSTTQFIGVGITSYNSGGSSGELSGGCSTCTGLTENISFTYTGIKIDNFTYNYE